MNSIVVWVLVVMTVGGRASGVTTPVAEYPSKEECKMYSDYMSSVGKYRKDSTQTRVKTACLPSHKFYPKDK